MARNWTEEQNRAIYGEGDLLVSAAAGAGKTAVLTERIARLISEGVGLDELLVVTFTNAAAAEMKERIEKRLLELASSEPDREKALKLVSASEACGKANISTLHSFCMNVLRRNCHEAGLDPAFTVAEALDAELLAKKAVDEVLEEAFLANEKEENPGFSALLTAVKDDERLEELIRSLHTFAVSRPDPEAWLDMAVSRYTDDYESTAEKIASSLVARSIEELSLFSSRAKELRASLSDEQSGIKAALDSDLSFMLALSLSRDYDSWVRNIPAVSFERLSWKRFTDEAEKAGVAAYRNDLKKYIKKLEKRFSHTLREEEGFSRLLAPPILALKKLVDAFSARFTELKQDACVIDFSDMEQLTLRILKSPGIAEEYRARFSHIFVDEYQDINPAQEAILYAVSRDNRFMVGDVKQSIYRFRQAEPAIFIDKYRSYKGEGGHIRIDLNRNFRSGSMILDAVNLLFMQLMRGGSVGEIDYSDNASLVSGSESPAPGEVELTFIDPVLDTRDYFPDDEEKSNACLEAAYTADRILDIMENGTVYEDGTPRRYRFSDFAVLLRSARGVTSDWISTLADRGIPCVAANGEGFYESIEVRLFMSLLRVIDNRRQDIPLLAVMRSPIFGFTSEELAKVRLGHTDDDVLTAVEAAAKDTSSPPWSIKCRRMLDRIENWRRKLKIWELGDVVASVLDEIRLCAYIASLRGGSARVGNLETIVTLAGKFASGGGSLAGFIRYMDDCARTNKLPSLKAPSVDAVRLMTIHASKGLEFDTVFLGDITKKFRRTYNTDIGIFDAELGIGLCSVSGDTELKSMLQREIASREASRLNAEEMRLLYVAMTRAKKRLVMLGIKKKAGEFIEKYSRPLDDVRIMRADFYADWILGAYFPNGADVPVKFENGGALFPVTVGRSAASGKPRGLSEAEFEERLQEASFKETDGLKQRFEFRYPFEEATRLPSKLTVTGLTLSPLSFVELPRFMEGDRTFTAAEAGTLTHRLLGLIPIREHDTESVRNELELLTERGIFTEEEAKAVNLRSVVDFFRSDIGIRLTASPRVEREREFEILLNANELIETDEAEPLLLQGVIDCCFIEDGAWVLLDHKTTRVDGSHSPRTVAERYRRQLELYALSIEKLTGIPVREKYVYLLSADKAVKL